MSRQKRRRAALGVAAFLLAATACGGGQAAPVDQQPRLAALLTDVDNAITARHYLQARENLDALVKAAVSARDTGTLDNASAGSVLATAARLRTELTATMTQRRAAATTEQPTTEQPTPSDEGDEGGDAQGDEGHGHGHEGHGRDKPKKND